MASLASVFVTVRPDTDKFEPDLRKKLARVDASKSGSQVGRSFGSGFTRSFKSLAVGFLGGLGVAGGIRLFTGFISDAKEAAKIGRLTEQVIKSTGGSAKISAKGVADLAEAISNKTAVDDEAIQASANLLLTFTNLRNETGKGNDIFNQATKAVVDMSAALGQDAKSSSIQLGKALNDPIKGITALSRVGVSFTAQQKEQIKTFVEQGDILSAQKVILAELGKEFGGAAEAAAGPLDKLKVIAGNLGEQVGTFLLPYLEDFATWLTEKGIPQVKEIGRAFREEWLPPIQAVVRWVRDNNELLIDLAKLIAGVVVAVKIWTAAQWLLNIALNANPIGIVILALAAMTTAVVLLWRESETFREIVKGAWAVIQLRISNAWSTIKGVFAGLKFAYEQTAQRASDLKRNAEVVWAGIRAAIGAAWRWINLNVIGPFKRGLEKLDELWGGFKAGLEQGIKSIPGIGSLFGGGGEGGRGGAASRVFAAGARAFPLPPGTYRWGRGAAAHGYDAQDLPVPTGTPVFAPTSGYAKGTDLGNRSYGKYVQIASGSFGRVILAHLSRLAIGAGFVRAGQLVGYSGSTGNSTGPHLHVEPTRVLKFDRGGWLPTGASMTVNNTGSPERIIAPHDELTLSDRSVRAIGEVMGRVVLAGIGSSQHATAQASSLYSRSG